MAELKWASISVFSPRLARLVKGKSARLRASRIREHMTMSLSGPVPRSHSPEDLVRSSRVMRGDPSGGAGLAAARLLRNLRGRSPRGAGCGAGAARTAPVAAPGHLAHVPGRAVESLQAAAAVPRENTQ